MALPRVGQLGEAASYTPVPWHTPVRQLTQRITIFSIYRRDICNT